VLPKSSALPERLVILSRLQSLCRLMGLCRSGLSSSCAFCRFAGISAATAGVGTLDLNGLSWSGLRDAAAASDTTTAGARARFDSRPAQQAPATRAHRVIPGFAPFLVAAADVVCLNYGSCAIAQSISAPQLHPAERYVLCQNIEAATGVPAGLASMPARALAAQQWSWHHITSMSKTGFNS